MPNLTFVLPHWLYWMLLALLPPLVMLLLGRRRQHPGPAALASVPIASFLLLTGGFVGCHRFYLKSPLGRVYVPVFIGILLCNIKGREARNQVSLATNGVVSGEFKIERFKTPLGNGRAGAAERLADAEQLLLRSRQALAAAGTQQQRWDDGSRGLALLTLLLLALDAARIPGLCRRYNTRHTQPPPAVGIVCDERQAPPAANGTNPRSTRR